MRSMLDSKIPTLNIKVATEPLSKDSRRQTAMYIKSGGEQTAHRRLTQSANVAHSGSIAKLNGPEPPVMKVWFTFWPSRSA